MKNVYLFIILSFSIVFNAKSQTISITSIVAAGCPTNSDETGLELIEMYVDGTLDVTNIKIEFQFNFASNWVAPGNLGVGEVTDTYLYYVNDTDAFASEFPGVGTPATTGFGTILFSSGGGDKIRLVDTGDNDKVLDIYGIDGQDGENETWNFNLSYAQRKMNTQPSATFIESDWSIQPKSTLFGKGTCWTDQPPLNTTITLPNVLTLSTSDFSEPKLNSSIWYNASSASLQFSKLTGVESFALYSISGKLIMKETIDTQKGEIQLSHLPSGLYFVVVNDHRSYKFLK